MKTAAESATKGGGRPWGSHSGVRRGESIRGSMLADMLGLWYVGPGRRGEVTRRGPWKWISGQIILFYFIFEKKREIGENVANFPAVVTVCRKFEGVPALGSYGVPSVTDSQKNKKIKGAKIAVEEIQGGPKVGLSCGDQSLVETLLTTRRSRMVTVLIRRFRALLNNEELSLRV